FPIIFLLLIIGMANGQEPVESDTLKFPFNTETGGLYLDNQINYEVVYDPINNQYVLWPKIGGITVSEQIYLSSQEYLDLILNQDINGYYKDRSREYDRLYLSDAFGDKNEEGSGSIIPSFKIKSRAFETIFGGNEIQLIP